MVAWIVQFLSTTGYWGIVLLMCAENVFPPLPSELIMPFAGFTAARGDLNLAGVIAAGTVGSLLGALPWYWAGYALGHERLHAWADRHGRWLTVDGADVDKAYEWFRRHCGKAVLLGRLVPTVRTLISVPAGITRMSFTRFLLYSALGSAVWNTALAIAGHALGERYDVVAKYLDPVTKGILALIVAAYLYRVFRGRQPARS